MTIRITLTELREKKACEEQQELFHNYFGESVEVSREAALLHASEFDWDWAAAKLLSKKDWAKFSGDASRAFAECNDSIRLANQTAECARVEVLSTKVNSMYAHDEALMSIWRARREATELAWSKYAEDLAIAFVEACAMNGGTT